MAGKLITDDFDKKLVEFIKEHHLLTVGTTVNDIPYCFHCFYAYLEDEKKLVFTSSEDTKHVQDAKQNPIVSAGIGLETKDVTKIQGAQIVGEMYQPEGELKKLASKRYMKRFPFAKLMKTNLWIMDITYVKMTDNRLGFGKKLIYGELPK
jgi:uncharacterized protein YhbP (UPF0306 family)